MSESGMPVSRAGYEGDEGSTFSWQAADELLSALAASPSTHHRLAAVKQATDMGVVPFLSVSANESSGL